MTTSQLTLGVVALGPVVPSSRLTEHEVVRSEDLAEGSGPHTVHGAGLQVHQDGPGHVLPSVGLIVVDVDPLQLEVGGPSVGASGVDAVLVGDYFPELEHEVQISGTDLNVLGQPVLACPGVTD